MRYMDINFLLYMYVLQFASTKIYFIYEYFLFMIDSVKSNKLSLVVLDVYTIRTKFSNMD